MIRLSLIFLTLLNFSLHADITNSQVTQYSEMLKEGKLEGIDVRSVLETKLFSVEKAKHIPLGELEEKAKDLNKDKLYLIFCESGGRAEAAKQILEKKGFKKLINVKDWRTWRKISQP